MKNKLEVKAGNKFLWKGVLYELISINELYFTLQKLDDKKIYRMTEDEFYKEYRANFIVPYTYTPEFYSIDLNTLDDKKQKNAIRISRYLTCFLKVEHCGTNELINIINKVSEEINDPNPPCVATLYNWNKSYVVDSKIDFSYLIAKQIRTPKISEEVENIIKNAVNDFYLNSQRVTIRQLHRLINNLIWKKNIAEDKKLKEPAYETIRQFVNLIDKKTVVSSRYGSIEAIKQYKTYKQGIKSSRILEYVEIDHVFLDIEVSYDDVNLGRPILTLLIDNFSLSILGLYIGFGKPNTNCVIQAIKSAILPKEVIHKNIEGLKSRWFQYGIMENLIVDNGKEFHSNDFKSICLELGVNIQYAPPYHPWYKRYIENFFSTLNKKLIDNLPGSYHRSENKKYSLPYHSFIQVLYIYIVDIYHNTYNQRKRGTPYSLWKDSQKNSPVSLPFSYDEINIIMSKTLQRSISKSGISIDNIYYNDENLNFIRRNTLGNCKVKLKRNWEDISYIYVFSDFLKKYFKVNAVDQEYTRGKTVFQHECILKISSKDAKNESDRDKIYSAVNRINEYLLSLGDNNKKAKRKDKVLYYKNVSSSIFNIDPELTRNDGSPISDYDKIKDLDEKIDDNDDWSIFSRD